MRRETLVVALVVFLSVGTIAVPAAATSSHVETDEPMFHVDISENGDATLTLVSVYNLTDDDRQAAFESLADDTEAQQDVAIRFRDRLRSVATELGADGAATVSDASVSVRTDDQRGIVAVSATWQEFATVDGDQLTVTEPFGSGFEPDRPLVVSGPEGAIVTSTSHEPASSDGPQLSWSAGSDLSGFELVYSTENVGSADETPGFDAITALIALVIGTTVAARR